MFLWFLACHWVSTIKAWSACIAGVYASLNNFPSKALNFSIISAINNVLSSMFYQLNQLTDLMLPRRLFLRDSGWKYEGFYDSETDKLFFFLQSIPNA